MLKYLGEIILHMGVSPKWVKSKRRREEEKKERTKVGNNNGQLRFAMPLYHYKTRKITKGLTISPPQDVFGTFPNNA